MRKQQSATRTKQKNIQYKSENMQRERECCITIHPSQCTPAITTPNKPPDV